MMTTPPTSDDPFGWINQLPAALERPIEFPKLEIDNFGGSFADEEMFDEYHRIISKAEQLVNSSEYKYAVDIVEQFLGSELLQTYQVFVDEVFGSPSYLYVIEFKESIERVRILLGQLKEFSGDYAGAVRCFRHAYECDWHDDERWEMHTMLTIDVARAYLGDKQFAEAIEALEFLLSDFKHNYPPEYSLEDRFYDAEEADFIFCVDAKARFLLGTTLLLAPDNLRDPIRALNLFSKSAIYFPLGGLVAGKMYEIGLGSVRSAQKASEYFTIARKHGVGKFDGILITANEGLGEIDKPIDLPDNTARR
jgi:tetratricopeptide (TPR) repeat protein